MRKAIFVIADFLLSVFCLVGCGKEQEQTNHKLLLNYGIVYAEESLLYLPNQIACDENGAWIAPATAEQLLYYFDRDSRNYWKIEWNPGEKDFISGLSFSDNSLYVCSADDSEYCVKKQLENQEWEVIAKFDKNAINESYLFCADADNHFYFMEANQVVIYDANDNSFTAQTWKHGMPLFLTQGENGVIQCMVSDNEGISFYEINKEHKERVWKDSLYCKKAMVLDTSDLTKLVFIGDDNLYIFERESGNFIAGADFLKSGISSNNLIAGVFGEEEGDMISLYGKNDAGNLITYQLSKQEAVEKTELVYGTFCLDNDVHEQIIAFNQQNPDYYITVRLYGDDTIIDYYEYYDDQKLKLQAELASGTAPDILDMYSIREYVSYAEKGYLEDLTDYLMQLDSSEELFWRVLDAYSVNGKHCVLLPFFSIAGIVLTPEQTNRLAELGMDWNMESFLALVRENTEQKDVFIDGTAEHLLDKCVFGMQRELIDYENKSCNFTTPAFCELLEFCREYGTQGWTDKTSFYYDELAEITLFMDESWLGVSDLAYYDDYVEGMVIAGQPINEGQTYIVECRPGAAAIYAGSTKKEGAWEFLKMFLEPQYQESETDFSIFQPCLNAQIEAFQSENYYFDQHKEPARLTQERIDSFYDILQNQNLQGNLINYNIKNIILEEAQAYFAGDKSASEVAASIQGRVQLILDE